MADGSDTTMTLSRPVPGSLISGIGAYLSVRFLTRYFETRSLRPFGIYCLVAGLGCLGWFTLR